MSDLKNFGMMIPTNSCDPFHRPDQNGVPVYDKCPAEGELCACTGKCRRITGYKTDPESVKKYHEQIEALNKLTKERMRSLYNPPTLISDDGVTQIYTWEAKQ
jgi:hypothetical protein